MKSLRLLGLVAAIVVAGVAVGAGAAHVSAGEVPRFFPLEVFADSGARPLGAWQVEVRVEGATLVGVEGGEHAAFAEAPFYDPAAIGGGRVRLAAFRTGDDLPTGRTRIATLHLRSEGDGSGRWRVTEVLAADAGGDEIEVRVELITPSGGESR